MTISTSRRSSSSPPRALRRVAVAGVEIAASVVTDGNFHPGDVPAPELVRRQRALVDLPWTMLDQRHGVGIIEVDTPGAGDGAPGDIAVTGCSGAVLGCWVGDCAPIVLIGRERFAVVHAGWRGLAGGVVDTALAAVGAPVNAAVLGPTIGPCCYEFGRSELEGLADALSVEPAVIAAQTSWGSVALDVPAAVRAALAPFSLIPLVVGSCTGCSYPGYSHRVRAERGRHVVAAWRPAR